MSMSKATRSKQQSGDMNLVIETLRRQEWDTRSGVRGEVCLSGRRVGGGVGYGIRGEPNAHLRTCKHALALK